MSRRERKNMRSGGGNDEAHGEVTKCGKKILGAGGGKRGASSLVNKQGRDKTNQHKAERLQIHGTSEGGETVRRE